MRVAAAPASYAPTNPGDSMIGRELAHYEILASIGAGGMGEVYRARDRKLQREVAIKILPSGVASGAEDQERLRREARTLAALNHPNITVGEGRG